MKRNMILLIVFVLIIAVITGCSNQADGKNAEQETFNQQQDTGNKTGVENEQKEDVAKTPADMRDMDGIYEFVKQEIINISKKNFDTWEVFYCDITGDGTDEAVLVSTYGSDWYEKMEIISGDSGEYKRIPSDISLAKYGNTPAFEDGFLAVMARYGGTGEHFTDMNLYIYNGSKIINVLQGLCLSHTVSFPDADFEETAEVDGRLTDFTYTLTKMDNLDEKETIISKDYYTYNSNTMSFDVKPADLQATNDIKNPESPSNSDSPIVLSILMTMDEITAKLGNDYTLETQFDGGYYAYCSLLQYDGISFTFFHDTKELSPDESPDGASITSNNYTLNYDFKIGDPALEAFKYCERNLENAVNHHSDSIIFDMFYYKEVKSPGTLVDTHLILTWSYSTAEDYSSKSEISEDVKIESISIFAVLD